MIMGRADICLLLPSQPISFGDKVGQLRRRTTTPRCLFGPPDPAETQRLLQEQMQRERERFQRRWNIDLDAIETALEKNNAARVEDTSEKSADELRIPSHVPTEVEDRLTSTLEKEEKTSKSSSTYVPSYKKMGCKKPCSKFQKRLRVAGGPKRQTHLTEFWRARRSISFVFGKSKVRSLATNTLPDTVQIPQ